MFHFGGVFFALLAAEDEEQSRQSGTVFEEADGVVQLMDEGLGPSFA